MRSILQKPALRFVFAANVISMLGSGMNSAAVAWYILQATHSEMALGTFAVLQTIPAMLMLPFTGVIIDREDRRRLVMMLDAARAVIILAVSDAGLHGQREGLGTLPDEHAGGGGLLDVLADNHCPDPGADPRRRVRAREHFSAGRGPGRMADCRRDRWIRLQPHRSGRSAADRLLHLRGFVSLLLRGAQGTARGAAAAEFAPISWRRKLRSNVSARDARRAGSFFAASRSLVFLGMSWALFLGAMMTGVVVTAPLSDSVFHAGAVGYGWLNAGWGAGAFLSALYAPLLIARIGRAAVHCDLHGLLTIRMAFAPFSPLLAIAVLFYALMGSARGVSGVAMNTSMMEQVPQHFMGRVQNTFYFAGHLLQICLALAGRSGGAR